MWLGHVIRMRESSHAYAWVISHMCMSHVAHTNHLTYDWVYKMRHVTHVIESWARVTCKWVTAHTRTSHDTHMTQLSIMSNMWIWRVTCMHESCHTCSFSHTLKAWHTWLTFLCRICMTWQFTCVTRTLHMCDMTLSQVWHDSFTRATSLIAMCGITYSRVRHDSFTQPPRDPRVFMCCSVWQCVAVCGSVWHCAHPHGWLECHSPGCLASRMVF